MVYFSRLINKPIYLHNEKYGTVLDMGIVEKEPGSPVSKIVIKHNGKKITIPPTAIGFEEGRFVLRDKDIPHFPYDENDFYLSEDLLDKQVIDIDGKRVVRVNDILLEINGEYKIKGIDIGFAGVLRRLGLSRVFPLAPKTLPWQLIEAFDYQTGSIQVKLTQDRLSTFHPSEIADILEELGTKERLGIFDILDAQKAAMAIEETNTDTQVSILEQLSPSHLKDIANRMLPSELADVFYKLNPLRSKEIESALDKERARTVRALSIFPDDEAGGLMEMFFYETSGNRTIKEVLQELKEGSMRPEAIVITTDDGKFNGIARMKDFVNLDPLALMKDEIREKTFVHPEAHFSEILRLFSEYNLRILPVVDHEKKILGVITIDKLIHRIEEEKEKNESI